MRILDLIAASPKQACKNTYWGVCGSALEVGRDLGRGEGTGGALFPPTAPLSNDFPGATSAPTSLPRLPIVSMQIWLHYAEQTNQ